ncbi:hypothetical protein F4818DRAFT_430817 [Hypoxylon cercidicola]|nr:hypothetical protein F4818DRAFT_430817 [Hypoxylon cercidicola]
MTSSEGVSISQHLLYRWDSTFDSPHSVSDRHYEPFVNNVGDGEAANPSIDLIPFFMGVFDGNGGSHYATDTVVDFCAGADLSNLQHDEYATTELVALLNDSGGMSARDLFQALTRPRIVRTRRLQGDEGGGSSITHAPVQIDEAHTEIRRLYVANLNRWTVLALAASAPDHQASILGEFIFKHLQFDPLINTRILYNGLPAFAFAFHLPYFALRKHRLPQRDKRRTGHGKELRQCYDITFLRTMDSKIDNSLTEYVYEAKLSCLVSGLSRYSWSAYLFNDLYFDSDDEESVAEFHAQRDMQPGLDPLSVDKFLDKAPCEPREYFLYIFEIRISRIKKEWVQLFVAVDEAIRTYKSEYWARTGRGVSSKKDQSSRSDADRQRTQSREELQEWMRRSAEILRKFISPLEGLISEWNVFRGKGINYFQSTNSPDHLARLARTLTAIDQHITDLGRILPKFNHTMGCLSEDMSRDVNLHIAYESNELALCQQKAARDVNVLTWITFLTLPLALAAALLSTQQGFIPITPSPGTFVASLAILETLLWLILGTLRGWGWVGDKLQRIRSHLGAKRGGNEDIELRELEGLG